MNIIFVAPPAAGKGTQSALLVEKYGFAHISTGDLLRAEVAKESDLGNSLKEKMSTGELISDDIVIGLLKTRLMQDDIQKGFEAVITGKCMQVVRKLASKDKSITAFITAINGAKIRKFPDAKASKHDEPWFKPHAIDISNTAKLYMCLFLGRFEFVMNGNNIMTDDMTFASMQHYLAEHGDVAQAHIKAYLGQCGAKRSKPAANDPKGEKMKAANEEALKNLNLVLSMICKLHALPFNPLTQASWELDKPAVAELKKALK